MTRAQPKTVRAWAHLVGGEAILSANVDRDIVKMGRNRWGLHLRGRIIRVEIRPVPKRRRKAGRKA